MHTKYKLKQLKERRDLYQIALEDLHMSEPSETWYKISRDDLESKIVMIENTIYDIEHTQKIMRPFFWTTVGFIVVSIGLLIYAYVQHKI